jgi:hypothetical protein
MPGASTFDWPRRPYGLTPRDEGGAVDIDARDRPPRRRDRSRAYGARF